MKQPIKHTDGLVQERRNSRAPIQYKGVVLSV